MPPTHTNILIHTLFGTKNLEPVITPEIAPQVHSHIQQHLERDFSCPVQAINGRPDHLHILFMLNPNYPLKDLLKNIKGESSHWINERDLTAAKFVWEIGYTATSVCHLNQSSVVIHIGGQEQYHTRFTFREECRTILTLSRFDLSDS